MLDRLRVPSLVKGVVQVWHARAGEVGDELAALLTDAERSRAERFVFAANRDEFVLGRAMLRQILAQHLDVSPREIQLQLGRFGKPALAGKWSLPRAHFSVSHSAGLVVAAFSLDGAIGVDVEDAERFISPAVQRQVFTPEERQAWELLSPEEQRQAAVARWTLKEAYLKARGAGLNLPLLGFEFDESGHEPRVRFGALIEDDSARWQFHQARVARHVISLALAETRAGLPQYDFHPHLSIQTRHPPAPQPPAPAPGSVAPPALDD